MSVVSEILSLRSNQTSSVEMFFAALDWQKSATDDAHILSRGHAVTQAADLVLMNVAAYAAEAMSEPPTIRRTRHALLSSRRKTRRTDPGHLLQWRLCAMQAEARPFYSYPVVFCRASDSSREKSGKSPVDVVEVGFDGEVGAELV